MPQNIPVVIIDRDADDVGKIVNYIKHFGGHVAIEGVANSFESGFEIIYKKRPMVVIMEMEEEKGIDATTGKIAAILERFPQMYIFVTSEDKSSDAILKIMRAGAAEYILKPISEQDLASALQKVGRLWISKVPAEAEKGRIYTLFSPKGGVGLTTIATNLAADIYEAENKPTLLVDMDFTAGDVTTFLNMKTSYTITDVTLNISRLDESFLKGVIARHETGVYVLSEPQKVEEAVAIPAADVRKLLRLLKTMFNHIIVDTENVLNERTLASIEMADVIILVFVMSLPGIKHLQRHLKYFENIGLAKEKIRLVVNRYIKKGDIDIEEAQKVLGYPISWSIPNDYESAMSSLNKGVPISTYKPKSFISSSIKEMAKAVVRH